MKKTKTKRRFLLLKYLFYFLILATFIPLASAQDFYIHENGLNSLHLAYKNDLKIGFLKQSEFKGQTQNAKFLLAYSPFKHISLHGGYFNIKTKPISPVNDIKQKGSTYSIAIAAYLTNDSLGRKKNNYMTSSIRAGYSNNNVFAKNENFESTFKYDKYFGQISFNQKSKFIGLDIFLKYNLINYKKGDVFFENIDRERIEAIQDIEAKKYFSTLEYKIQILGGFKAINLVGGYVYEIPIDKIERFFFLEGGSFYLGAVIQLNDLMQIFQKRSN